MTPIDWLKEKLKKRPEISWSETVNSIRIEPTTDDGFPIELSDEGAQIVVSFADGWHENFTDQDEALECVAFGLSDSCRLRVLRRGGTSYNWTVEYEENGNWWPESTTGLLLFPFWRRKEVAYFQNRIIEDGEQGSEA